MLIALTRGVSPNLGDCELQDLPRQKIDIAKAVDQHRAYEACLRDLGARVVSLPADARFPDGVFVEDPAVVVDEMAVMTRMGALSRRGEGDELARVLGSYRPLVSIEAPATLEGGDVMRIGKTLYVGLSRRTNAEGIRQLRTLLARIGYHIETVTLRGCLHLKSACCYLGRDTMIANRQWVDAGAFRDFRILDVPPGEPRAANVLAVGDTLIVPSAFPQVHEILRNADFGVRAVDVSEFAKAEGGVTCTSIVFEDKQLPPPGDC